MKENLMKHKMENEWTPMSYSGLPVFLPFRDGCYLEVEVCISAEGKTLPMR